MEETHSPDRLIEELGGCGRYQWRLGIIIHSMKTVIMFSFSIMMVAGLTPTWRCVDGAPAANPRVTMANTTVDGYYNVSLGEEEDVRTKACVLRNKTCESFEFDGTFRTFVTEFSLVCDDAFIPSTVMSIQMTGVFFGNVISGQLGSLFGRKLPLFASMFMLALANILGFFSTHWIMFAATRVLVGLGGGFFLSVQYSLLCEFTLAKWRSWAIGFPSAPIQGCMFALCAWLIDDWRYIQLVGAGMGVVCMFLWWYIPESFRWHYARDETDKANNILDSVAKFNRKPNVLFRGILEKETVLTETTTNKRYTVLDMFKSRELIKLTLLSAINWFNLGFANYGISFGVQKLSGNVFFNLFLFSVVSVPSKGVGIWFQNRFGRRKTALLCYITSGLGGLIVGIVQYVDTDYKVEITNGFAMVAIMGAGTAWGPVQTMTIELYPTVIRTIGFGTLSTMARIGAILGPQFVFLDQFVPGILFFAVAVVSFACVCGLSGLNETKDSYLSDKIKEYNISGADTQDSKL